MVKKFTTVVFAMALFARLAFSIPIPDEQHQQEHEEITSVFKNIGQELQGVYDSAKNFFDDVAKWFENLGEKIKEVCSKIANFFENAAKWFKKAYADTTEFFETVKEALGYGDHQHHVVKRHA